MSALVAAQVTAVVALSAVLLSAGISRFLRTRTFALDFPLKKGEESSRKALIDGRARETWFEHSCWSFQGNGGTGAELEVAAT